MGKRPNIIIINPDQMRADSMRHLGNNAAVTPSLDQLAKEGVSFSKAFCQNPVCTPSRCSFMSGWYPHVAGHRTMNHMMHSNEPVLFYATVEEIARLPKSHTHFGKSLVPFLNNKEEKIRDEVFCEGGFRKGENHCKETGGQEKPLPTGLYYPRQFLQASDEMFNGKAVMIRTKEYKYIRRLYEEDEFYDFKKDSIEVKNEIDNPEYKELIMEMKERLLTHYQDTCDVVPFKKDRRMDLHL